MRSNLCGADKRRLSERPPTVGDVAVPAVVRGRVVTSARQTLSSPLAAFSLVNCADTGLRSTTWFDVKPRRKPVG